MHQDPAKYIEQLRMQLENPPPGGLKFDQEPEIPKNPEPAKPEPQKAPVEKPQKKKRKFRPISFLMRLMLFVFAITIPPFFILVRSSMYFLMEQGWMELPSYAAGITITGLYLGLCSFALLRLIGLKKRMGLTAARRLGIMGVVLVLTYSAYGLVAFSSVRAKTDEVRQYYSSIHPILRVSVLTAATVDEELLITDAKRDKEWYEKQGLPERRYSKHFEQSDGYVHAVDLRTIGRNELRNDLVKVYFELMGFKAIRHTGTADHLHIQFH